ncbi:methylmalonyl-CoA mutase family protein [Fulvivirga sp. M361]|uniref:methylmalonyl-CoA mutase family protein n=1 Tax=Fulvivirga sp. M361 TaxID=2594266 RepID=UPI0016259336|nr:methylmalonyl-CoA mutase family protein [Fulvivirga sp. M361]
MNQNQKLLFSHFSKVNKEKWAEKATNDLKGEDVFKKYTWELEPGIHILPYYDPSDLQANAQYEAFHNRLAMPDHPTANARVWHNLQHLTVEDEKIANREARDALNSGADGIIFNIPHSVDFKSLLENIKLEHCNISFQFSRESATDLAEGLFTFFQSSALKPEQITGTIELTEGTVNEKLAMFNKFKDYTQFRVLLNESKTDTHGFSESIAAQLKATIQLIEAAQTAGNPLEEVLTKCTVNTSVGPDYFAEIAKIRALRMLFFQVARAYDVSTFLPEHVKIRAVSDPWINEAYQPHGNMLKASTGAMAAILGGCDELLVVPEDNDQSLMVRIARNVSSILKEEVFLKGSADPVAGSYYLENLTNDIAQKAWHIFQSTLEEETVS